MPAAATAAVTSWRNVRQRRMNPENRSTVGVARFIAENDGCGGGRLASMIYSLHLQLFPAVKSPVLLLGCKS